MSGTAGTRAQMQTTGATMTAAGTATKETKFVLEKNARKVYRFHTVRKSGHGTGGMQLSATFAVAGSTT